ncbi:GTPase activating factor [Lithohypha guttulata]|uniref:GTPase activating factor n=1 Tax=Lithohypha guttulata TaxID=1690604 RepID=A0AAN7Y4I8_9EURO|nr:GTPase activating factor [Lithohypha guttulata]
MKKHDWDRNGGHHGAREVRRLSRRRSDLRRDQTYGVSSDRTIRAVTPDSTPEITALPSPSSFTAHNPRSQTRGNTTSVSNTTDEESGADRRKVKKKQKDVAAVDTSPNSSFFGKTKGRLRLGSITSPSTSVPRLDDPTLSIGFPSVVQASVFPDLKDLQRQLPKATRRTFSSDSTTTATASSIRSPVIFESDSERILKLMKTVCGRMHGILFYRLSGSTSWHSGYCAINVAPGSLVCQMRGVVTQQETLIPDLRGCTVRTHYDSVTQTTHLSVVLPVSGFGYDLRPSVPETFDSWLAALLCWQPLKPKGMYNKLVKTQPMSTDKANAGSRRLSDLSTPRSAAVVKSSQMLMWDGALPSGSCRRQAKRVKIGPYEQRSWRRVNCTLHENGTLRLLAEENATPIRSLRLNNLTRCAVQRLDDSVLGAPYCIAIHPQYTVGMIQSSVSVPLALSLTSRVAFEAWFVLLQAMTVPELYGPEVEAVPRNRPTSSGGTTSPSRHMFRIERSLKVRIVEAKFQEDVRWHHQQNSRYWKPLPNPVVEGGFDVYADVLLGRDLRARTVNKPLSSSVFWAEEFHLADIPSVLTRISIVLKKGNPDEREWTMFPRGEYEISAEDDSPDFEAIEVASHDPVYARVDVQLQDLEQDKMIEKWWALIDSNGTNIGSALIKLVMEEHIVLLESEYAEVSTLLHNFDNSLTSQLGQVLGTELKQLSDILLDIFQASDKAEEWINNLVEEEIDGIYREQPPSVRMRFSGRIRSNDSYESAEQRELLVRDLSRSATLEANLLFRGNSLVTKALDAHMRRIGKEYLERTLGEKLRAIVANNPNCEVDPNKISSTDQLDRNWANLIAHTTSIWQSIAASVSKCPGGIRQVLKHVGSCAEDRYGSFIRTVRYTSVSGFLFLRLFCPCILNPRLFGLLEDHPSEKPRRTLTLIAKGLMSLANLAKFGQKEPWMEPMNKFITAATPEFKIFIDEFCAWSPSMGSFHEPQYQAAAQVRQRLPPVSREGLLSLPFLLDGPRSLATLVDLWMEHVPSNIMETPTEESVKAFHNACLNLGRKTKECMANAEVAQEPNSNLERQWQKMLSEQPKVRLNHNHNPFDEMYPDSEITALPQPADARGYGSQRSLVRPGDSSGERDEARSLREAPFRTMTSSTNSSNVSIEGFEDYRNRQKARGGAGRGRHLEISNHRIPRVESPTMELNRF